MTTTDRRQDVIDLLLAQHQAMKGLFSEVRAAEGGRRQEAFHNLVRLMAVHESTEEQVVHPAARDDAGDAVVDARLREENLARRVLSDLHDLGVDHPAFGERFAEFEKAVLAHAAHEEREEFPALRRHQDPDRLAHLAGALRAAEAVSPGGPAPAPPVALFDRARDAVREWRLSHGAEPAPVAGASTDQYVTGGGETGSFLTDEPPAGHTEVHGSSNAGINKLRANRPDRP
jgi:hemerythrin superfamily protein